MRNLKLLKSLHSSELQGPGSPQFFSVRADTGSLLVASQYSITEYDPRAGQVNWDDVLGDMQGLQHWLMRRKIVFSCQCSRLWKFLIIFKSCSCLRLLLSHRG